MTTYADDRTGHGRWCLIKGQTVGVLWEADNGSVGFQPAMPSIDSSPVTDALATCAAADRTPTEAFDQIAATAGASGNITVGSLDGWQPDSQRPSRDRTPEPAPDVLAALDDVLAGGTS